MSMTDDQIIEFVFRDIARTIYETKSLDGRAIYTISGRGFWWHFVELLKDSGLIVTVDIERIREIHNT